MSTTDLVLQQDEGLRLWRPPEEVLAQAQQAAKALQSVIAGKKKPVMFNGEQYIEFEDWQVLCQFFGYVPKVESSEFVEFGNVQGFRATAVLLNERTGEVVSRAESMCLNNEEQWGMVTEYEWKDVLNKEGKKQWDPTLFKGKGGYIREKVQVGERQKPLFQLMSMAQTRACAKVCRNKLSWVVVLAGYRPTPAEEIDHSRESQPEPQPKGRKAAPVAEGNVICSDCGKTNGHDSSCKYSQQCPECHGPAGKHATKCSLNTPKNPDSSPAVSEKVSDPPQTTPAAELKPNQEKMLLRVLSTEEWTKGNLAKLNVTVEDNDMNEFVIGCWDKKLWEPIVAAKEQVCVFITEKAEKNGRTFYNLVDILAIGATEYTK